MESETLELQIADVVYRGKGLARTEGMVCFVPGVLPGETVKARVTTRHRRYLTAELLDVVVPSPARVAPICPLAFAPGQASPCPGCAYQHVTYAEEIRFKQSQLSELLAHHAGVAAECFADPVASPKETAYRNKIVMHEGDHADRRVMGYIGDDNRTIVDVLSCPLAVAEINDAVQRIREDLPPHADGTSSRVEHAFRHTPHDGAIHFCGRPEKDAPRLTEATAVGEIQVPLGSFFQVNRPLTEKLIEGVQELLQSQRLERVIDLYCGVGLFALIGGKAGATEVLGIDTDRQAIRAAKHNASHLELDRQTHFLAASAAYGLRRAMDGMVAGDVTLIADPPRSGLDKGVLSAIREFLPGRLIYVSCAADTLARDLRELVKSGYRIDRAQLFDMFPRTALFGTVVALSHAT